MSAEPIDLAGKTIVVTGGSMVVLLASSNTLLQTIVEDDKRGRVMSLFAMAFMGMAPFGSLFAGGLAGVIGAPWTVGVGGLVCLAGAAVFALRLPQLRSLVRPLYVRMGILPEMADGVQAATALSVPPES